MTRMNSLSSFLQRGLTARVSPPTQKEPPILFPTARLDCDNLSGLHHRVHPPLRVQADPGTLKIGYDGRAVGGSAGGYRNPLDLIGQHNLVVPDAPVGLGQQRSGFIGDDSCLRIVLGKSFDRIDRPPEGDDDDLNRN